MLIFALNVGWPIAEFGGLIKHKTGSTRHFKTLGAGTNEILRAGIWIGIETATFPCTVKALSRSYVVCGFYRCGSSLIKYRRIKILKNQI